MSAINVVGRYGAAIADRDMDALAATLAVDAVWHQPGMNPLSGDHVGLDAILSQLARFMELSGGTFNLVTDSATESGHLVATTVRFSASREGRSDLSQCGVDIFRVEGDRITEIWLISEDQAREDAFWA